MLAIKFVLCCAQMQTLFFIQADMPTPIIFAPLSLPRQTSPAYGSQPVYSANITASATLQSANPVIAHESGASAAAAQVSGANNIVTAQYSRSSSTATAAMLDSLRPPHGGDVPLAAGSPPSESSDASKAQQQSGQKAQATATSRR